MSIVTILIEGGMLCNIINGGNRFVRKAGDTMIPVNSKSDEHGIVKLENV